MDARERLRELSDFAAPWAVWIAATLRLPDHLAAGPLTAAELAPCAGADPDALERLLRYLVARGVFVEDAGRYANAPVSELLLDESGWRSWFDLDGPPGIWAESWTRLLAAVRSGSPGRDEGWYYDELARTGRGAAFDAAMAVQSERDGAEIAAADVWDDVDHVVDVGGGTGALLRELLAARPQLRGTLFDLPQVVAGATPADRLAIVAGDLFADPLPHGDVYVLSRVLHGWPDERAAEILSRCAAAGGETARILLVETLLREEGSADHASFDLFMLTLVGGRERREDDLRRLGETCGLVVRSVLPLSSGASLVELGS